MESPLLQRLRRSICGAVAPDAARACTWRHRPAPCDVASRGPREIFQARYPLPAQMAIAERLAVIGLLETLRPECAIELGTASGGKRETRDRRMQALRSAIQVLGNSLGRMARRRGRMARRRGRGHRLSTLFQDPWPRGHNRILRICEAHRRGKSDLPFGESETPLVVLFAARSRSRRRAASRPRGVRIAPKRSPLSCRGSPAASGLFGFRCRFGRPVLELRENQPAPWRAVRSVC